MDAATRQAVRERAGFRCEYCHLPEEAVPLVGFHVEHVIARQHLDQNQDDLDNLALACDRCNAYKGTNIASIDPETGQRADLFHPRRHRWSRHFKFRRATVEASTSIGRATVRLLRMNDSDRVELRDEWLKHDDL